MSSLLTRLQAATRRWHSEVEMPWRELMTASVSRADYLAQLVRMYGVIAPFESACKYTPNLHRLVDSRQLNRAGLLAQDLMALALSPAQVASIPQCEDLSTFVDVTEALGWLYVIERAIPTHDTVRLHLVAHIPEIRYACAFLSTNDTHGEYRWETFARMLDLADEILEARIIAAAEEGFRAVRGWLRTASMPLTRITPTAS